LIDQGTGIKDKEASMPVESRIQRRRVAYLTESFTMGGVERSTALLACNIDRERFEPLLLCPNNPAISSLVQDVRAMGVDVIQSPLISTDRSSNSIARIRDLARMFRSLKIDILHIQVLGGIGARYVSIAARLAKIPVVIITIRGAKLKKVRLLARLLTRLVDRLTVSLYTVASEDNRRLQLSNIGRDPNQIKVIYNAIEVSSFDPTLDAVAARQLFSLPQAVPIIGTISRLDPQKGLEYFLLMAEIVHASVPEAHFFVVGEGQNRLQCEETIAKRNMKTYVHLAGYRNDIDRCLAAMDIFVLASMYEPFGLVLAEAMAMQKPVVATRVGGIPEVVDENKTALLAPSADPKALADAVLVYLSDPELMKMHAAAGLVRVHDLFSPRRLLDEFEGLYEKLLS
jgi:glycosyltransferase involved in cell wall biosynthesis